MNFGLKDILNAIQEDSTTSVSADLAELSEGADVEAPMRVDHPNKDKEPEPDREEETYVEDEGEVQDENEEEEEQESEEELPEPAKDLHPFERPSIKQITEQFPDLFKKFPSLRDMYFREAEFSRAFPTIEDAKEAAENNEAFTDIREDVFSGDGSKFLSAIKEVDEKKLESFASKVLPSLIKVHPAAFWRAANPLVEDIARNMFAKGVKEKDESLQNAARYLSDYFFGNTEVAEGKKTTVVKEESSEVAKERETFDNERYNEFRGKVSNEIVTSVKGLIDSKDVKSGKSRLDPDDVLSPFIKSTIIDRIILDLGKELASDKDHIKFMDSLWAKSKRNGRTDEDKARIVSAYLARAKSLIPSLRSKYVSEALGKSQKHSDQRREKVSTIESRRDSGTQGSSSRTRSSNYNPKVIDYRKTSDEDILNDNISYK
jgi:hypothetical protein